LGIAIASYPFFLPYLYSTVQQINHHKLPIVVKGEARFTTTSSSSPSSFAVLKIEK